MIANVRADKSTKNTKNPLIPKRDEKVLFSRGTTLVDGITQFRPLKAFLT
jgi:hypothetical protein